MSLPAIEVSALSKRYVIQHESRHDNLRDQLHHTARKLWRRFRWGTGFDSEEFWALRDVSFTVQPGEVVGIIGRNGAGKSTLLKILSRITEPTSGTVKLRGRVASLLEVGTGFHPELSGRENIFLNGAILGMSRAEIRKKFDEIVAFSEVEKFLDTPVKRYSSGMYVRLAFAVAAHLEPEILIVDEVLAVGDAQFQKKCLGKMQDVAAREGRTVLFVSHNEAAVRRLCTAALFLQQGSMMAQGATETVLTKYFNTGRSAFTGRRTDCIRDRGTGAVLLSAIELIGNRSGTSSLTDEDDRLVLTLKTQGHPAKDFAVEVTLHNQEQAPILFFAPHVASAEPLPLFTAGQSIHLEVVIPSLASGKYLISVQLVRPREELYATYPMVAEFTLTGLRLGYRGWTFTQSGNQGCILATGEYRAL